VEGVEDKGGDVAGYMPLQRQVGFIYDSPNLFIIAHELGHGAFNLRHTFSPESFIAAERTTQNLMDYAGGTELWVHQWELIRDPQSVWFAWAQEEGEGEMVTAIFPDITFFKHNIQRYGFDKNDIKTVTDYNKKNIIADNTFEVPWQMVRLNYTGTDNNVNIEVKTKKSELCSKLFLVPENEIITDGFKPPPATAVQIIGSNQLSITPNCKITHNIAVMGMGKGQSGFKVVKDSIKGELIGAVNILTADERNQNVYVVTVHLNTTGKPDTSVVDADLKKGSNYLSSYITSSELTSISMTANEIYNQALLNVNFTLFNTSKHKFTNAICLDFDLNNDGKIDASSTTEFTSEQKKVISEFGKYYSINADDKVLFIIDKPAFPAGFASNQFVLGIMKLKQQYGFIYKDIIRRESKNLERVISHELGHGFNLLHPEQCPNVGNTSISNNIMNADIDNTGKKLILYQWIQLLNAGK